MDQLSIQTDKVLLTVFVSVLVGFLTAALSIVRLVNDKESKTTEYRQLWNDSLRKCFAELISHINILAGSVTSRHTTLEHFNDLTHHQIENDDKLPASLEKLKTLLEKKILDEESQIHNLRRNLHHSYALTRLHFKPNDLSFSRIEQKFDVVLEMLDKLSTLAEKGNQSDRAILKEKIHAAAAEMTGFARDILKTEWEAVKRGERAYQRTKFWSIVGGAIALFIICIFGLTTAWSMLKAGPPTVPLSESHPQKEQPSERCSSTAGCVPHLSTTTPSAQTNQVVNVFPSVSCPSGTKKPIPPGNAASQPCSQVR